MSHVGRNADFLNKERWEQQRHTTVSAKLSRIIDLLEELVSDRGSPCPVCGDFTLYSKAPKNAPDFLCRDCHDEKMDEDEEWRAQTLARRGD